MSDSSHPFGEYEFRAVRAFSAEQHRQLAIECGISSGEAHAKLLDTLVNVSEFYPLQRNFEEAFGPIKSHRERLDRIAVAALALQRLIAEEPLAHHLLSGLSQAKNWTDQLQDGARFQEILLATMEHLAVSAEALASNQEHLRTLRIDPKDGAKSVERREIWEPVFRLWRDLGKGLGYTEGGPIMRVLQIVHVALGLEPPNPYSVRQALRDFKEGGVLRVVK